MISCVGDELSYYINRGRVVKGRVEEVCMRECETDGERERERESERESSQSTKFYNSMIGSCMNERNDTRRKYLPHEEI